MSTAKPLLFLDVDGPLSPFGRLTKKGFLAFPEKATPPHYTYEIHTTYPTGFEKGLRVLLAPAHGVELVRLASLYTLVWATTWRHDANKWIGPRIGLPQLPVVDFQEDGFERDWVFKDKHRGSWKTLHLAKWLDEYGWYKTRAGTVARLPWAFVDDEANRFDGQWLARHWNEPKGKPVAPRKLLRIDPHWGLTAKDFAELEAWGRENSCE